MTDYTVHLLCGCKITVFIDEDGEFAGIIYCPRHATAPELYEALRNLLEAGWVTAEHKAIRGASYALALADGNSDD